MRSGESSTTLRRFFAGLAESTFQTRLGVVDPPLVDYLSDMLLRFVRCEAIFRVRNLQGRPIRELSELLCEANERVGAARRAVYRHVGDVALFWTGVFPESLRRRSGSALWDRYGDYCAQGKRSYLLAATIEPHEKEDTPGEVLTRLGSQFELCAYGLREVRRQWEESDEQPPTAFLIN